ncbi:hypothetical protein Goari_017094 [Gossypium aridum]|uniref:Uso1/p115-like vesicle tethering protein C-terminal domain-containing protein n=1 Tax=Gossypium aridum TaxID=34290 RepID=A0A7J8WKQ0_GOSAI|nr:hypothetical protein [Gossypium aridum]
MQRSSLFSSAKSAESHKPLTRSAAASTLEIEDVAEDDIYLQQSCGSGNSQPELKAGSGSDRVQVETLRRDLLEASPRVEMHKAEKAKFESEASTYQNLAGKLESDLKSLSDAYNSLERSNHHLEKQVEALESGRTLTSPDIEASKVERLSAGLWELGEGVDKLLEGIGDDTGLPEDEEEED